MVQTSKITGQMIISDDGTVISSSGDLSSNEATAKQILSLVSHTFPIALKTPIAINPPPPTNPSNGKQAPAAAAPVNGSNEPPPPVISGLPPAFRVKRVIRPFVWKTITVDFGNHSYVACLSNRKIHVVKREKIQVAENQNEGVQVQVIQPQK